MSAARLVWANLFRKRTRSILTVLSVAIAFLLFALLQAIGAAFDGGVSLQGVDRLIVSPKYSIVDPLPVRQREQILAVDGVEAIVGQNWFGGIYQDRRNFFPKYPVRPRPFFDIYGEFEIEPDVLERFARIRTAAVAGDVLMQRYGWQVGDIIPITADIWPKADGTRLWEFELVGSFTSQDERQPAQLFLFRYEYFTEAVASYGKDQVGWWTLRLDQPDRAAEIASEIDALFENSQTPTRSATEDEFQRQFAKQLGNISLIVRVIMGAVFFTIILLTANTMGQGLRERIPDLAVLKTLGFGDAWVSGIVLLEALLLVLLGAALGMGVAYALQGALAAGLAQIVGVFEITSATIAIGFGLAVAIGLLIGALPARTAHRLTIVEALRRG
ncbi:MAG: ABC transporter permease [Pseudomonadota bacterium]